MWNVFSVKELERIFIKKKRTYYVHGKMNVLYECLYPWEKKNLFPSGDDERILLERQLITREKTRTYFPWGNTKIFCLVADDRISFGRRRTY